MIKYLKYLLLLLLVSLMSCSSNSVNYDEWNGLPMSRVAISKFPDYVILKNTSTLLTNGNIAPVDEYGPLIITTHKGGNDTVNSADDMDKLTITANPDYRIEFKPSFDRNNVPPDLIRVEDGRVLTADMHALVTKYGFTQFFAPMGTLVFVNNANGARSLTYELVI